MYPKKKAFTLIELLLVVIIISILALTAFPRYYDSVAKAQKNTVYYNMDLIRQALLGYYAAYGAYPTPNAFPITVTMDGDAVIKIADPSNSKWTYNHESTSSPPIYTYKQPGSTCWYGMKFSGEWSGTCTP